MSPLRIIGHLAVVLAVALGLLAGPAHGQARPKLRKGLLTVADLPSGYRSWKPVYEAYQSSTAPACSTVLDELEYSTFKYRGVEYASAGFSKGQFGPWVLETLRRYPTAGIADRDLTRILGTLRGCSAFSLAYTGAKPTVIDVKVTPMTMPKYGTRSKAMWITANVNGAWAWGNVLVLARSRGTLMVLSQLSFKPPTAGAAHAIAARAAARLRAVAR
ncbi:hypothetical protein [Nonomuraea sp. NPDC048916]|uniref:hypothetical protein n=1 Tax=Nonomuraea sp. NPDC048916 TaxID=3154232 RepID=UPI0033C0B069